jgi:hypothetical protein
MMMDEQARHAAFMPALGVALLTDEVLEQTSDLQAIVAGSVFTVACVGVPSAYQLRRYSPTAAEETQRWTRP